VNAVTYIQIMTWYSKYYKHKLSKTRFAVAHHSIAQVRTKMILLTSLFSLNV